MNQTIIDAIKNRCVLRIEYHGFYRLVEPHTYGVNALGHDVLSGYQTEGGSKSNASQGWKLLLVNEVRAIAMTDTAFQGARRDYVRNTETMQRIYAQL